jgi:tRNA modification GTPase
METQGQIDEYKAEIEKHYKVDSLVISTKNKESVEQLREKILEVIGWSKDSGENVHIARTRHLDSISKVKHHLMAAIDILDHQILNLELIAEELRLTQNALSEITGEFTAEDLLGEIFSKFCIGK